MNVRAAARRAARFNVPRSALGRRYRTLPAAFVPVASNYLVICAWSTMLYGDLGPYNNQAFGNIWKLFKIPRTNSSNDRVLQKLKESSWLQSNEGNSLSTGIYLEVL